MSAVRARCSALRLVREQAAATGTTHDETYAQYARETPLRRLIPPEGIAAAAVFLASHAAASITGEDVNLSGGLAMY